MVKVTFDGDTIHLEVQGLDKLWAFKSQLNIPLQNIKAVRVNPDEASGWWHGIKTPGTNIPGLIVAGTFHQHDRRVFWDVHDPAKTVILELHDDRYDELIIQVEEPEATERLIRSRIPVS